MLVIARGRLDSQLGFRKRKDEPTMPGVYGGKAQDVAEEAAVGVRVFAVSNKMRSVDHCLSISSLEFVVDSVMIPARFMARKAGPLSGKPKLLAGGNPQIAKGDGDLPVEAYIAAMPDWKQDLGRRLDALIVRTVPNVRKAVRWNSPFYGIEGQGWFLSFHCFTKYVKVAFFRGASLRPPPPGESKQKEVRYLDLHEGEQVDEEVLVSWIEQASRLPGWEP
jgi:hypothetical protein